MPISSVFIFRVGRAAALIAALALAPHAGSVLQAAPQPDGVTPDVATLDEFEQIFDAFYRTGLDASKAYAVNNLTLRKDNMSILLEDGTVFLARPVGESITGAAFIGRGRIRMTPPNRTGRYMLTKYGGAETLDEPFSEAVFRFSDGSAKTILASSRPAPDGASLSGKTERLYAERNSLLNGARGVQLEMHFIENRISSLRGRDFFLADFNTAKHGWIAYYFDPVNKLEHGLYASESLGAKGRRVFYPWITWHLSADYGPAGHYLKHPDGDGMLAFRIKHHEMTLDLPDTRSVRWERTVTIEPLLDNLAAIAFDLVNNADFTADWTSTARAVRIDAVTDGAGRPLPHMHRKDRLLVLLNEPLRQGTTAVLKFRGESEVIYQLTAESYGLMQTDWYPQIGFLGGRSTFRWTVRVPRPFLISGSGTVVRRFEDEETKQNGLEMKCDIPAHFPWIIFGRFQHAETVYEGPETASNVPMTIHSFPTMTYTITDTDFLNRYGLTQPYPVTLTAPRRKVDAIFEEGKEILKLFENIYGPYPYEQLHIAQMAPFLGFGQAPQGFVQLTGEAFMSQAQLESDFFHGFLAHEFAHQWWAHQIGWASGDDEWLSESFAEYAAGIFVKEFQGAARFQQQLSEWRERAKMSDAEAPIAAANTLRMIGGGRHRNYLLYNKGPYVVHMLRVQLGDEMYVKAMRSIMQRYGHQDISTEMLLSEINRVTGSDYTYFFDQWFWDVGIPTFRYSWRADRTPEGKYLVTVQVSQDDKDRLKRVLMPIHLHFKKTSIPQYRPVVEASQEIKILVPEMPKDVTLDDERTLLAEIVKR